MSMTPEELEAGDAHLNDLSVLGCFIRQVGKLLISQVVRLIPLRSPS